MSLPRAGGAAALVLLVLVVIASVVGSGPTAAAHPSSAADAVPADAAAADVALDESVFVRGGLKPGEREKVLYVWTRDADHEDSDFLAVVDVEEGSETYGTILHTEPVGSAANEAHHFGYNVDADRIYAGGITTNRLFIFDLEDPRKPALLRTVDLDPTGYSGPHSVYAVPGGVMVAMLGAVGGGGPGALIKLDDEGDFLEAWPVVRPDGSHGFMYDVGVNPSMNVMTTSSWSHPHDVAEGTHLENAGREIVVWNWETKEITQIAEVDPAPFAIRWMHGEDPRGGFTCSALGGSIWFWEDADEDGELEFHRVLDLGEPSIPVDMRVSYDNRHLYVSLWGEGKVQQYDIADPRSPRLMDEVELPQPNMMKLTPDSRRLYVTNSILSSLDGEVEFGAWLLRVGLEGMSVDAGFAPDFARFESGPAGPHDMLLR